ncbi:hypothetical protein B296_00032936 [Ensete ventricosum]|uniref:Uncharacterized protein n=1 Tax=Ensete ventricosum TaxID=4639 RepID=A0A426ZBM7_ENSVE|nr:hypothetical protein B296_00032936 [Ensete ventricosum]
MVKNFARSHAQSHVSIGFSCTILEIQNIGHSDVLAHGKSYEHDFTKKLNSHKLYSEVEFRSVFCALSWKFKILGIPDSLAHGKSYEQGFTKKWDGHKHCMKSCPESIFDRFFMHRLRNSKYWPFPTY